MSFLSLRMDSESKGCPPVSFLSLRMDSESKGCSALSFLSLTMDSESKKSYTFLTQIETLHTGTHCLKDCKDFNLREPAWPGGKVFGWYAGVRRFDSLLWWLTFLFKKCDLWTLSRDFALHN